MTINHNMHRVIFFNGPPRVGKDTAVGVVWSGIPNATRMKFAGALRQSLYALLDMNDDEIMYAEHNKDNPRAMPCHRTFETPVSLRTALINLSEKYAKDTFGPAVFGHLLVRQLRKKQYPRTVLISDSGFASEAQPVVDYVGKSNCLLIRLHRAGCGFDYVEDGVAKQDSRSYITLAGVRTYDVDNNGTTDDLRMHLLARYEAWSGEVL